MTITVNTHLAKQALKYFFTAGYWRGHHVHSPFVYHIVRHVITTRSVNTALRDEVRRYRSELLSDKRSILVDDFGTGASLPPSRGISQIARRTSTDEKFGLLLQRLVADLKPRHVVELGTSLGVGTMYLSSDSNVHVTSIEGSPATAQVARQMLDSYGRDNVDIVVGNFDDRLPEFIQQMPDISFVYVDGNHTYDATMRYFNMLADVMKPISVIVFDDIHWSEEMTRAWNDIKCNPRVMTTIDLLHVGIAFLRDGCQKEDYIVRW